MLKTIFKIITQKIQKPISAEEKLRKQGVIILGKINVDKYPCLSLHQGSKLIIEDGVSIISDPKTNPSGIVHPCTFFTQSPESQIIIGKDSGLSGVTLCCMKKIIIGEYVGLGSNVSIYDNDFHAINPYLRKYHNSDNIVSKEVFIDDFAWIGANTIILKGVHIGRGAVVGAGSVVTSNIPPLTVYAGNPARFIRNIEILPEQYNTIFS